MADMSWDPLAVGQWLEEHQPPRPPILAHIEDFAWRNNAAIVGPVVGRFLHQMARTIGAKRIFVFGSAIGYTALWLALAIGSGGVVVSVENEPSRRRRSEDFAERAGLAERTSFVDGDAMELFTSADNPWDLAFINLTYSLIPESVDIAGRCIREGGLFIAHNVFLAGRGLDIFKPSRDPAEDGVRTFTRSLLTNRDFLTSILPLGDGLAVALRVEA